MNEGSEKIYAVVTGDIIGSSRLSPPRREKLLEVMKRGGGEVRKLMGAAMPWDVDIYSGDTWQFVMAQPGLALKAAIFYRAYIKASLEKADTRFVVALGTISLFPQNRVSEGDGEAFRRSGRLLQDNDRRQNMRFAYPESPRERVWDVAFALLDGIITHGWSEKGARAVLGAIQKWPQQKIAELWLPPISQPTVAEHLELASWPAIELAVGQFEQDFLTQDI